jgi:hypothetical protein
MVTKVEEKVWSLEFAERLVIVAKSEREMKEIKDSSEEEKAGSERWEDEIDGVQ